MEITFIVQDEREAEVAYYDDAVMVVYKPAYMHSVTQQNSEHSLESFVISTSLVSKDLPDSGLLQRLDYLTAGLLLVARNLESYLILKKLSHDGLIKKKYQAVARKGEIKFIPDGLTMGTWLRKQKGVPWDLTVESRFVYREKGRSAVRLVPAQSHSKHASAIYKTMIRLEKVEDDRYYFLVKIEKGYRHQVRATLASLGFPIIGDTLYGGEEQDELLFYAIKIKYPHPLLNQEYSITWERQSELNGEGGSIEKKVEL